jgi:hypothetical protein
VLFDRLVDVVGDSGAVHRPEELPAPVDEGTVEATDEALKDGLDVAAVAPQAGRKVPAKKSF